jgi:hypothetical protein
MLARIFAPLVRYLRLSHSTDAEHMSALISVPGTFDAGLGVYILLLA